MAVLSTKGQIVIPKKVRKELYLKSGMELTVEKLDKNILRIPHSEDPVRAMYGMLEGMFEEDAVTMIRRMRDEDREKERQKS